MSMLILSTHTYWTTDLNITFQSNRQKLTGSGANLGILDIGSTTGGYAAELAKRGHSVTLTGISNVELEQAKRYAATHSATLTNVLLADAREIGKNNNLYQLKYYDIIPCQGPFYDLMEHHEHQQLLADCCQMLEPGSFLLTAFITIYAHLGDLADKDPISLVQKGELFRDCLESGRYSRNPAMIGHHTRVEEIRNLHCDFAYQQQAEQ